MTNYVRDFLRASETDESIDEIIIDYERFERQGYIGPCRLRMTAEGLMLRLGTSGGITHWMRDVAFEATRLKLARVEALLLDLTTS